MYNKKTILLFCTCALCKNDQFQSTLTFLKLLYGFVYKIIRDGCTPINVKMFEIIRILNQVKLFSYYLFICGALGDGQSIEAENGGIRFGPTELSSVVPWKRKKCVKKYETFIESLSLNVIVF